MAWPTDAICSATTKAFFCGPTDETAHAAEEWLRRDMIKQPKPMAPVTKVYQVERRADLGEPRCARQRRDEFGVRRAITP